jgi:hypothetical protein
VFCPAFNYPVFVDEIKTWYEDAIGDAPRGDGSLNEYQLKVFIGRLLKEAYRGGLMPKAAFFSDGAMSDVDIENIIERRSVSRSVPCGCLTKLFLRLLSP